MKKVWKWILGIVIVLVVVGVLVAAAFAFRGAMNYNFRAGVMPHERAWNGHSFEGYPGGRYPMGPGMGMPGGRGYSHFGGGFLFLGLIFRAIIPLGLLALLVYGAYWLGKRKNAPSIVPTTPIPAPVSTHACDKCGNTVQDDWRNCPYCGKKQ